MKSDPPAILSFAFRPFFLAASLWAALALGLWIFLFMTGADLQSRFDPLTWHIHEMLFGFVLAAIAGFILTAIPNWTGRPPIKGVPLFLLVLLWILGRLVCAFAALMPIWLAAGIDLAFPAILFIVALGEIIGARNWRNLAMSFPIAVLFIADLLMYLETASYSVPAGIGWRLGIAAIIALISAIGGRIIPAFTGNWLRLRNVTLLPPNRDLLDRVALATLHTGFLIWVFLPTLKPLGGFLLLAAAINLWRLYRWRGFMTLPEPLLAILHLGYLWVIIGTALLGASLLTATVPLTAAIHALTAGAMGTMILAVMTRVARGHTGRLLAADRVTVLIYSIITISAITRVAAAFAHGSSMLLLAVSAILWIASFGLFAGAYGPMLLSPRIT